MKLIKNLIILLLALIVILFVGKNFIVKAAVEGGVKVVTGLPLSIAKLDLSLSKALIDIEGLKLSNPSGFKEKTLADIPVIYLDYDLPGAFSGKQHIEGIKLYLKEFVVVKNSQGALNINSIKGIQAAPKGEADRKPKELAKPVDVQIDFLELKIDKVVYKDYSKGGEPSVKSFNLNINERFENIDNPNKLVRLIVAKALIDTSIGNLANIDLSDLTSSVSETLLSSSKLVEDFTKETYGEATKAAGQMIKETRETVGKTVDDLKNVKSLASETGDSVKNTAEEIKDSLKKLKIPFGNNE